jgi:hypothetical protein
MRDRVCPIEECAATVRFDEAVVEVTPRYRLHDLDEVDEFASCPECGAAIAGFHPEDGEDEGEVELILDIDGEDESDGDEGDDGAGEGDDGAGESVGEASDADEGLDAQATDFDDPDEVLADAADDGAVDDEAASESVFGSDEDE